MIFCLEDDESIRDLMIYTLNVAGYEARGFGDSEQFWEAMKKDMPELVLLDIMLPGEDGIAVLKRLRNNPVTAALPVIMATAKSAEYDKVIGFDSGADDYLTKPFGMMEMVSRIKAVLRRSNPKDENTLLSTGSITMDLTKHTVTVEGTQVILTLKEYDLLKLLMENIGKVFTRERLLSIVWGIDFIGETRTVDVHVGTLRSKLGAAGDMISTVRGVGYRIEEPNV